MPALGAANHCCAQISAALTILVNGATTSITTLLLHLQTTDKTLCHITIWSDESTNRSTLQCLFDHPTLFEGRPKVLFGSTSPQAHTLTDVVFGLVADLSISRSALADISPLLMSSSGLHVFGLLARLRGTCLPQRINRTNRSGLKPPKRHRMQRTSPRRRRSFTQIDPHRLIIC